MQTNPILNSSFESNWFQVDPTTGINIPPDNWTFSSSDWDPNDMCLTDGYGKLSSVPTIVSDGGAISAKIEAIHDECTRAWARTTVILEQTGIDFTEMDTLRFTVQKETPAFNYGNPIFKVLINDVIVYSDYDLSYLPREIDINLNMFTPRFETSSTIKFILEQYIGSSGTAYSYVIIDNIVAEFRNREVPQEYIERIEAIELPPGYGNIVTGLIDKKRGYMYFGTGTYPGNILRIRINPLEYVDMINLTENYVAGAVIDNIRGYAYFPTGEAIIKVDLDTFTIIDSLQLPQDLELDRILTGIIDEERGFAYFGDVSSGYVGKLNLDTFTLDSILEASAYFYYSLVGGCIDKINNFAYFGTWDDPGTVIKIDLNTFTEMTEHRTLYDFYASGAYIDNNGYAYFDNTSSCNYPNWVAKMDVSDPEIKPPIEMGIIDGPFGGGWPPGEIDKKRGYLYLAGDGCYPNPGTIAKIKLDTFQKVYTLTLDGANERFPDAMVIDEDEGFLYVACSGTTELPSRIVKIDIKGGIEEIRCITKRDEGIYSKPRYCYVGEGIFTKRL